MTEERAKRKLTAILSADVKGYSSHRYLNRFGLDCKYRGNCPAGLGPRRCLNPPASQLPFAKRK